MGILDRLISHKEPTKTTVWGIRVPKKVKIRWLILSAVLRVPTNRLIMFILNDWVRQNTEMLVDDKARNQLADKITELYLKNELN